MATARTYSRAQLGLNAVLVTVEVHLGGGLSSFSLVGLPKAAVREARSRVRSAIEHAGFTFPEHSIIVNLAPADLPKEGSRFDLAIAVGILAAAGYLPPCDLQDFEFLGELGLSGKVRGVSGVLPSAIALGKGRRLIVPADNLEEASLADASRVHPIQRLMDVRAYLSGQVDFEAHTRNSQASKPEMHQIGAPNSRALSLNDVRGQALAKRALVVAAAGAHHMLMEGPPGTGKTMLARRLAGFRPPPSRADAIEAMQIHSIAGSREVSQFLRECPFRSPHHTASAAAMIGGGQPIRPGEVSLSHKGVLFLDELPEFNRSVLEALREPLESREVHIARARGSMSYPADVQLVAAMNPCPAGYDCEDGDPCRCAPGERTRYRNRLSGPLLDRIDIHVRVNRVPPADLLSAKPSKAGEVDEQQVRQQIARAYSRQVERAGKLNRDLSTRELERDCALKSAERKYFTGAAETLKLSARGCHRTLKVARTIADLEDETRISRAHLSEALGYKSLEERTNWQ